MGVVVTRKPGGISQLYTDTGNVTYKCKSDSAFMLIEAFGVIVKFNKKGAIATVNGEITSLDSCDVIKKGDSGYKEALTQIIQAKKDFAQEKQDSMQKEIQTLENQLSNI